jgi:hypothetical protein
MISMLHPLAQPGPVAQASFNESIYLERSNGAGRTMDAGQATRARQVKV